LSVQASTAGGPSGRRLPRPIDRPRVARPLLLPARGTARAGDHGRSVAIRLPAAVRAGTLRALWNFADDGTSGTGSPREAWADGAKQGPGHLRAARPAWALAASVLRRLLPGRGRPARPHGHVAHPASGARFVASVGV